MKSSAIFVLNPKLPTAGSSRASVSCAPALKKAVGCTGNCWEDKNSSCTVNALRILPRLQLVLHKRGNGDFFFPSSVIFCPNAFRPSEHLEH